MMLLLKGPGLMLMMLLLLKGPGADADDAGLAGVAARNGRGLMLMMLVWPRWLLKGPGADAHDAAAERAGG